MVLFGGICTWLGSHNDRKLGSWGGAYRRRHQSLTCNEGYKVIEYINGIALDRGICGSTRTTWRSVHVLCRAVGI